MEISNMEKHWIWLASAEDMTGRRFYQLLAQYEDPREIAENLGDPALRFLGEKCLASLRAGAAPGAMDAMLESLERSGQRVLTRLSPDWPEAFDGIVDPPHILYLAGEGFPQGDRQTAVVGSRRASRDGLRAAREISEGLAREGVTVLSGMARGIDTQAHVGCLDGGGRTVAVLGCGLDVVYPPENRALRDRILSSGGLLVGEYAPGTPPVSGHFPRRNRLISALSQAVIVVEGERTSGAMITANLALEQGRDVFAVPGSIYAPMSVGPNNLIRDGAPPILSHWDLLESMHWGNRPARNAVKKRQVELSPQEKRIVDALAIEEKSFEELALTTGFTTAELNSLLTILELRGIILKAPGQMFRSNL